MDFTVSYTIRSAGSRSGSSLDRRLRQQNTFSLQSYRRLTRFATSFPGGSHPCNTPLLLAGKRAGRFVFALFRSASRLQMRPVIFAKKGKIRQNRYTVK